MKSKARKRAEKTETSATIEPMAESSPGPLVRKYDQLDLRVLVFKLAGQEYVVDLAQVQEIIRPSDLIRVEGALEHVEGLIKRHGRIVPVIDLCKRLGLRVSPPTPETCVIITRLTAGPVGFVVDQASELMWIKTYDFELPSPVIAGADQVYLQAVAHLGERVLIMLDLERVVKTSEQEQLSRLCGDD